MRQRGERETKRSEMWGPDLKGEMVREAERWRERRGKSYKGGKKV